MPIIIAFGYKRERGKNTALDMALHRLRTQLPEWRHVEESFAYPLKSAAKIIFGFGHAQLSGELKGELDPFWGFSPRTALQLLGTDCMREVFGEDVWVKNMERRIQAHYDFSPVTQCTVLIGDLRFKNEAAMVHRFGGYLVQCSRDVPYVAEVDDHPSEHDLDDFDAWDFKLNNNGTKDDLERQVRVLIDCILRRCLSPAKRFASYSRRT